MDEENKANAQKANKPLTFASKINFNLQTSEIFYFQIFLQVKKY